jgi:O-antigen ligase
VPNERQAAVASVPDDAVTKSVRAAGLFLILLVFILILYSSWVWGGAYKPFQPPILIMGIATLAALACVPPYLAGRQNTFAVLWTTFKWLVKEPAFYIGVAFMALLLIQWLNAGRTLIFDEVRNYYVYSPPRFAHLPSAISRPEALEMVTWFLPAWALALVLRSPWMRYDLLYTLWRLMVLNSAVLAVFGIVQFASGTTKMYWMVPVQYSYFFASFGYTNHAGSFFTLMLCLSGALLLRDLLGRDTLHLRSSTVLWLVCSILNLMAANLSLSRAAILLSWTMAVSMIVYAIRKLWPCVSPAARVHLVATILAVVFLACFVAAGFGKTMMANEISNMIPRLTTTGSGISRAMEDGAAIEVWKSSPWFGVGGCGYRYMAAYYLPPALIVRSVGLANVHNDPLQFLAEFGLVGGGLMLVFVMTLARPIFRHGMLRRPALMFAVAGTAVVVGHSLVDLPFRCPAIIYSWLAILVIVGRLCELAGVAGPDPRLEGVRVSERTKD